MLVSRAGFLRGLIATAAMPLTARATTAEIDSLGTFSANGVADGAKPWTAMPGTGPAPLRFAVIGDNTGIARPGVFDQAMVQIGWLKPDFILSVGDMIEGYTDDKARTARQWAAIDRSIAKAGVPFVHTPGNHDINNEETYAAWIERHGAGYYAFRYKGALFLILNTEDPIQPLPLKVTKQINDMVDLMAADPDKAVKAMNDYQDSLKSGARKNTDAEAEHANISDKQLAFIRDTLARNPNPAWTFVVMHRPAWKMASPAFAKIQSMLGTRNYTVFAGHTHYFTHDLLDGHDLINMGTTGGFKTQDGPGTLDHTMLVTLGPSGPSFANTRLTGLMDVAGQSGQTRAY